MRKRVFRWSIQFAALCAAALLFAVNYSDRMRQIRALPETLYLTGGSGVSALFGADGGAAAVDVQQAERLSDVTGGETYTFRFLSVVPLRTVQVVRTEQTQLVPGGSAVGITLYTRGVLVVGLGSVETAGGPVSPGSAAGLQPGDVIVRALDEELRDSAHLAALCARHEGSVPLVIEREGRELSLSVRPALDSAAGEYRLGLWVRDSTAGVGTLSFYDAESGWFAALGHAISDVDTHSTLTVREGRIVPAEIVGVTRGQAGEPGELLGVFSATDAPLGSIARNTEYGVYGPLLETPDGAGAVPLAYAYEAHEGPATLLATVSDGGVRPYACSIVRVSAQQGPATKGMVVEVTDEQLLAETGGIVQGMSGSPVLQDGKLVGVVTHVFVNDPAKGYCIYAEWMYRQIGEQAS